MQRPKESESSLFQATAVSPYSAVFSLNSEQAAAVGRLLLQGPAIITTGLPLTLRQPLQLHFNASARSLRIMDCDGEDVLAIRFTSTLETLSALRKPRLGSIPTT